MVINEKLPIPREKRADLKWAHRDYHVFFSVEMCLYKKHFKSDVGQILATSGIAYQMDVNNHGTVAIPRAARRWEWIVARLKIRWGEMYAGFEETSYVMSSPRFVTGFHVGKVTLVRLTPFNAYLIRCYFVALLIDFKPGKKRSSARLISLRQLWKSAQLVDGLDWEGRRNVQLATLLNNFTEEGGATATSASVSSPNSPAP